MSGTFYMKNSSFIIENSLFESTFAKSLDNLFSTIYAEMNPTYFIIINTSFSNLMNNDNGPVINFK